MGSNQYLVVELPAYGSVLPFRVVRRVNTFWDVIPYGALPVTTSTVFYSIDDDSVVNPPADGVVPARAVMRLGSYVTFPKMGWMSDSDVSDSDDMFYISAKKFPDRVLHVVAKLRPSWLRVVVDIPPGTVQERYMNAFLDLNRDFGFARGELEVVYLPDVRMGWRFGNDFNFPVHTEVRFVYGEYEVEVVKEPKLVFDLMIGRKPHHRVVLPVTIRSDSFERALNHTYGFTGYPIMPASREAEAITTYAEIASSLRR